MSAAPALELGGMFRQVPWMAMAGVPVCLSAGLLFRYVRALRSLPGLVALGALSTALIFREAALAYLLLVGALYLFAAVLDRLPADAAGRRRRWRAALLGIAVLAVAFIGGRHLGAGSHRVELLGMGFALFALDMWTVLRLITFVWEVGAGRVRQPGRLRYAVWALLPFTLVGPVLRYSELEPFLKSLPGPEAPPAPVPRRFWALVPVGAAQLLLGYALLPVYAKVFTGVSPALVTVGKALSIFGFGPWSFMLQTGGYFQLMEAAALLCGLRLPPSFDRPFFRRNISDFWANWNMTATRVFRDYIFMNRWGMRTANPYLNSLLVFGLCGLWHASNAYWILWGLLHGAGFAAFLWLKQRRARAGRASPDQAPWAYALSAGVTYAFVCLCWYVPSKLLQWLGRA